jgi:hypothetical protein
MSGIDAKSDVIRFDGHIRKAYMPRWGRLDGAKIGRILMPGERLGLRLSSGNGSRIVAL